MRKGFKRFWIIVIIIIVLLIGIRAYLPIAIRDYVNRTLDRVPEYDGRIGDVDLALWRGAYNIETIKIVKTTGKVPVPFFESGSTDFSVQWAALLEGKVVGEMHIVNAKINFVNGPSNASSQTEIHTEWLQVIKDLFPLRINRFELDNGEIHFRDFHSNPKVDLKLDQINAVGTDFNNTRSPTEGKTAKINATARAEGVAPVKLKADVEPSAKVASFNLDLSLKQLPVTKLNDFLRAYAAVDSEGGIVTTDIEMATANNRFKGFIKLLIKDLQLFSLKKDSGNPLQLVWEGVVGLFGEIFENQRRDQIATEIPFSGSFDNPKANIWHTIGSGIRNAFIKAIQPGNENKIDLSDVKRKDPEDLKD